MMDYSTRVKFGSFRPYIAGTKHITLEAKYTKSPEYRTILQEEQKMITEKWQLLRQYFEPEELSRILDQANDKSRTNWFLQERKNHYQNNKEKVKEQTREYYKNNKEKYEQKVTCECGAVIRKDCLSKHTSLRILQTSKSRRRHL